MKNFFIIANRFNVEAEKAIKDITEYLKENGASKVSFSESITSSEDSRVGFKYTDPKMIPEDTEAIIVLGGDGTLLQASRDLVDLEIPLIGINFGNLGFLAEIDRENEYDTLLKLLNDEYTLESRMMLSGKIVRDGETIAQNIALNDIVISRSGRLMVLDFKISVNDQYLNSYRADGIIISTPTGSTAYNMSAGGPIVEPSANLLVVTPICPHTLNTRSIILDSKDEIEIEISTGHASRKGVRIAVFDGDDEIELMDEDRIIITKSTKDTKIIKMNSISFLQILRRKMAGNENSETK